MTNKPSVSPPRLRKATLDDYEQIVGLETAQHLRGRTREEWTGLWKGNPVYRQLRADWPIGWVLEDQDRRVVGTLGNIPLGYVFQGRRLLVSAGRGWAVDERYRSFALLLMDEYFSQENVDMYLNTTVNALAADAFNVFGSTPVPVGDWSTASFWVTGYPGFARSALRMKKLPLPELLCYPAAVALYSKDLATGQRLPAASAGIEVSREDRFDQRFDVFWEALQEQSCVLLGLRDRESLEWHFGRSLQRGELWLLTIPSGSSIAAYAIFQRRDEPRTGLKRMRLVDFQALEDEESHLLAVLGTALKLARRTGIHALEKIGREIDSTRLIDSYAPYTRRLPAWPAFYRAPDPDLQETLQEPEFWSPSSFDGDASL